jgi:hypothetical protein
MTMIYIITQSKMNIRTSDKGMLLLNTLPVVLLILQTILDALAPEITLIANTNMVEQQQNDHVEKLESNKTSLEKNIFATR